MLPRPEFVVHTVPVHQGRRPDWHFCEHPVDAPRQRGERLQDVPTINDNVLRHLKAVMELRQPHMLAELFSTSERGASVRKEIALKGILSISW